jgi:hypothetical protein
MKITAIITLIVSLSASGAFCQVNAFETLHNKFQGQENVFSLSTSAFWAKSVLWLAGEHEFRKAISDVQKIRFITIPKSTFQKQNVTVNGFEHFILKDGYSLLTSVRDHGDDVRLYLREGDRKRDNHYLMLVEESNEIVAFEIKGYVDTDKLLKQARISYNQ